MISEHFRRSEFRCRCGCGLATVDYELLIVLEEMRYQLKAPVTIVSGHRCEKHNTSVKGAKKSKHLEGRAVDIRVKGYTSREVYTYLEFRYPYRYGMGLYSAWVHIDSRLEKTRWEKG